MYKPVLRLGFTTFFRQDKAADITENNSDIDSGSESKISVNDSTSNENAPLWNSFVLCHKLGRKLSHLNFRLDVIARFIERQRALSRRVL
ncbi:UNVERIFIED_CONTAM: hypothetical protein NCL1_41064 [Trichonephila clavipes]